MGERWAVHPWVEQLRDRIGFAIQPFPVDASQRPTESFLRAGRLAEELGLDAVFIADHPAWGIDSWTHLAVLAALTEKVRLGTIVSCIYYRHPVLLARLAADLDNISKGRATLGVGIGWDESEFGHFGMAMPPARERQAALDEAIAIIEGVWGDEPFSFEGQHFQTTHARVAPGPIQQPRMPIIIAGGGERVTLRQVARYADACNLVAYGRGMISAAESADDVHRKLGVLRDHCAALGRPYESILRTYQTGWLILAEDEPSLKDKLASLFPEGMEQRYSGVWRRLPFAATPEQAAEYYRALRAIGIQYFVAQILDPTDTETIRLFAEEVAPRVSA